MLADWSGAYAACRDESRRDAADAAEAAADRAVCWPEDDAGLIS